MNGALTLIQKMEGLLLENELDIGIAFAGGTAPEIVSTPLLQERRNRK
jgi:LysR family cyn operon transcriptional activator